MLLGQKNNKPPTQAEIDSENTWLEKELKEAGDKRKNSSEDEGTKANPAKQEFDLFMLDCFNK